MKKGLKIGENLHIVGIIGGMAYLLIMLVSFMISINEATEFNNYNVLIGTLLVLVIMLIPTEIIYWNSWLETNNLNEKSWIECTIEHKFISLGLVIVGLIIVPLTIVVSPIIGFIWLNGIKYRGKK